MLFAILAFAIVQGLYIAFDRRRYHGAGVGGPGLRPTAETFRDPGNGKLMRVFENPQTGAREYRPEP
jgi:hypothetical protein